MWKTKCKIPIVKKLRRRKLKGKKRHFSTIRNVKEISRKKRRNQKKAETKTTRKTKCNIVKESCRRKLKVKKDNENKEGIVDQTKTR